jgi:hypothetical protein
MKTLLMITLAAGAALATSTPAAAREGCGPGAHRGPMGHCRPNRGQMYARPGTLVIGNFYQGRGYWDGQRYYQHRYRDRSRRGWRYR